MSDRKILRFPDGADITPTDDPTPEATDAIVDALLSPRIVALEHICAHGAPLPASEGLWLIYNLRAKMAECETLKHDVATLKANLEAEQRKTAAIAAIDNAIDDMRDTLDAVLAATGRDDDNLERNR